MRNSPKTCLIIPCYNEEKRLDIPTFIQHCSDNLIFVFVDDGSKDNTGEILSKHTSENWHLVSLSENAGKSEAIRQGVLYALKNGIDARVDWLGFLDSDLSVPIEEVKNFFTYKECYAQNAQCIIGSRVKRMGSNISRSPKRHYLGRCFCTLVSFLFNIHYYDTQCGAKLFKKEIAIAGFEKKFTANWIFDIELLIRFKPYEVVEYPLQVWTEKSGSKINFPTVLFEVIRDLMILKKKGL